MTFNACAIYGYNFNSCGGSYVSTKYFITYFRFYITY